MDKYRPCGYVDLLSDETINREVAKWLMCWRHCMEAGEGSSRADEAGRGLSDLQPRKKAAQTPEHKLLLLCGPPGVHGPCLLHTVVCCADLGVHAEYLAWTFASLMALMTLAEGLPAVQCEHAHCCFT